MFNPAWEHPLEMFSWQHFVALGVVLVIFLAVFFTRKFFIKYSLADKIFRYFLGITLILFELVLQLHSGANPLFGRVIADTYPLCGYLIWFSAIALLSNNVKLMKLIYPLTMLGGSLSLIVLDMTVTFPHFGAFQFWYIHAGFMLGSMYYFFTRKIQKFTLKDLGNSCIFLFCISIYVLLISSGKLMYDHNFGDPLFILTPPGGLQFIKDALGQIGYTTVYIFSVIAVLFLIYGITYLCTIKRANEPARVELIKENKALDYLSSISLKVRYLVLLIVFGLGLYSSVLYRSTNLKPFVIFDEIFFLLFLILVVVHEVVRLYEKQKIIDNIKDN